MRAVHHGRSGDRPPAALVTTHYWHPHTGGIESVAAAQAAQLIARGWRVTAHTSWTDRRTPRSASDQGFELQRHRVLNPLERWMSVPVPLPFPGISSRLRKAAGDVDVVLAHGHVYPITVAAARAARATNRPLVVMQHNPWVEYARPIEAVERLADRVIGRRVLEMARVVICVSRFTEAYVLDMAPRASTIVIPNGVDDTRFVRPPHRRSGEAIRFVAVRRLVPRSGIDVLIDAWRIAGLHPSAELVIVGDGPLRANLEQRAVGLEGIRFAGRVSDDDVVRLMQDADATVVPTRSGEGFGLVAAESHACGTPVIAADQGALPEVIRDGIDGLIVPATDADAFARALRVFSTEAELRGTLTAGAETTDWSWNHSGARFDMLLRDVLSGSTGD